MNYFIIISFLIIFFMYISYTQNLLDTIAESYYMNRIENKKITPKVYDISHKYLPDLENYQYISNIFLLFSFISFIKPFILIEFIGFIIPILIIRSITIHLTILPKTKNCDITNSIKIFGSCYDKIFSGHFSLVFLITLLLWKHKYISILWVIFINLFNGLLILATRAHYTIDIIVSFFITLFVFQNRFTLLRFFGKVK